MRRSKNKAKPNRLLARIWQLAIGVLVLSLLGAGLVSWQKHRWDGRSRFTVVDLGPPVTVNSLDPATHKGIRLLLPNELEVVTSQGRGRLPAGSLAAAGPRSWAAESVASYLGIFHQGEASQLKWGDKLRWWWVSRQIEWRSVDLNQVGLVNYRQTADEVRVGELAPAWEQVGPEWFTSLVIAQAQLAVRVINTTPVAGLAATAAREIESSGMQVVEVTSSPDEVDACQVVAPPKLHRSVGVQLLLGMFHCDWQAGDQLTLRLGSQYRRQVTGEE